MNDLSLYQQILGDTTPWRVTEVKLDAEKQTIAVRLELPEGTSWACPECRSRMHVKERRRRHPFQAPIEALSLASISAMVR